MEERTQTVNPARSAEWSQATLLLLMQLGDAQQPHVRMKVAEIYRSVPRPQGRQLTAALHPLVVEVLALAGQKFADLLGATPEAALRFADPSCAEIELRGTRAVQRRIDRIWGGAATAFIEAVKPTSLLWPGPRNGQGLALAGEIEVRQAPVKPFQKIDIPLGAEVVMMPGAQLLLRRSIIGSVLELAQGTGFIAHELIAEALGEPARYATAAGMLEIERAGCRLGGRRIRLTVMEAALLQRLAKSNGKAVAKAELALAVGSGAGRNVDHLAMGLRNKLGDGVIATIYGVGFALEVAEARAASRTE